MGCLALLFVSFQFGRAALVGMVQKQRPGPLAGVLMGAVSGFTSTIAHAGAPPVVIYLLPQQLPRRVFVGTTVVFFAALNVLKLPPYWGLGLFHADIFKTTLLLAPLAYAGVKLGVFLNQRFSDVWFNRVVYGMLLATAVQLITGRGVSTDGQQKGDQSMSISIQLPSDAEQRLDFLVAQTGRTKDGCLREIIERGLEDMEDYYLAAEVLQRVRNGEEQVYSTAEAKKALGLDD